MSATPPSFPVPGHGSHSPDIVVVGGGMAGVMAALAARTAGTRVLLVEPSNVLGGQGTAGGVAGFCGDTRRVNAPFAELVARLSVHELIEPYRPNDDRRSYDLEWCAFFLQEMLVERGVDILLHTRVIAAAAESSRVTSLTLATAGGLMTVAPRFVIDASGACVIPVLTGFPFEHEGANRQLPMSLYFTLWDTGRPVKPILPEGCPRWRNDAEIPMTSLHRFSSGKVEVKMKVVGFDAADGMSRSAAEIFARRQMHGLIYYLQTVGYRGRRLDTHVLAGVSRGIGVREERRIIGEHVLTEAEARRGVIFPDAVAVNTYHIDFHWPDRMERAGTGITDMLDPHHLPLRMMIPRGARNLLVPGRGASAEQTAMSAFRVMAVVAQMGFAAGHAARQCVERHVDLPCIDVPSLQRAIVEGGQSLDLSDYGEYLRDDLLAVESLPEPGGESGPFAGCSRPALLRTSNGGFAAAWQTGLAPGTAREIWTANRREKAWSTPRRLATLPDMSGGPRLRRAGPAGIELHVSGGGQAWISRSTDEGQTWSGLAAGFAGSEAEVGGVELDGTLVARAVVESGSLVVELSVDGGRTWSHRRVLAEAGRACSDPVVVATATGLAVLAVQARGGLFFWHGSADRIRVGDPAAPAHVLHA